MSISMLKRHVRVSQSWSFSPRLLRHMRVTTCCTLVGCTQFRMHGNQMATWELRNFPVIKKLRIWNQNNQLPVTLVVSQTSGFFFFTFQAPPRFCNSKALLMVLVKSVSSWFTFFFFFFFNMIKIII